MADAEHEGHDRAGRLDRSVCGLCDEPFIECTKCGVYTCACAHFGPCVTSPAE